MATSITLLVLSLIALYIGAEWLVRGSSSMAARAKISPLVIGLTVVAFGTSAPELVVSINASLQGQGDISIGNVVGSNIFNICVILGLSAIVYPLKAKTQLLKIDIPIMITASILLTVFFWDGRIGRWEGALFFCGIISYTLFSLYFARKKKDIAKIQNEQINISSHWYFDMFFIAGGLVILVFASHLLVDNAVYIAKAIGISEAVIGLTIVAAGTSMPELATSIVAAMKKNPEIAIGNIVGSNIFNILAILGISSLIKPITAPQVNYVDMFVMLGVSLLVLPVVGSGFKISRKEGILFFFIYIIYILYLLQDLL